MSETVHIGQAAKVAGVSVDAIRFYLPDSASYPSEGSHGIFREVLAGVP